jgi:hypothetical protein
LRKGWRIKDLVMPKYVCPPDNELIPMDLYKPEIRLILRLRQLRKTNNGTALFLVTQEPLAVSTIGNLEVLETVTISGSSVQL